MYRVIADNVLWAVFANKTMANILAHELSIQGAKVEIQRIPLKRTYAKRITAVMKKPSQIKVIKNPLKHGYSPETIGQNIAREFKRGVPHAVAIRRAYDIARSEFKKRFPNKPLPAYLKGVLKFSENPIYKGSKRAIKKKSLKKYLVVAITKNGSRFYYNGTWFDSNMRNALPLSKTNAIKISRKAIREFPVKSKTVVVIEPSNES